MKIKFDTESLVDCLEKVAKALPKKSTLPITDCFLMSNIGLEGMVKVSATNLEFYASYKVKAKCEGDFTVAIPAKILLASAKLFREAETIINTTKAATKGTVEVRCGKAKYTIGILSADEFPIIPTISGNDIISIGAMELKKALNASSKIVSDDELKPALMNIQVGLKEDKVEIIACNQYFMSKFRIKPHSISKWGTACFSPQLAPIADKCFTDKEVVDIHASDKRVYLSTELCEISCSLFADKYPNTDGFFSKPKPDEIKLNAREIKDTLDRLILYSSKSTTQVGVQTDNENKGTLYLWSQDIDYNNEGIEEVEVINEKDIFFGANIQFFSLLLDSFESNEFTLNSDFAAKESPIIIKPVPMEGSTEDKIFILMPVMIERRSDI